MRNVILIVSLMLTGCGAVSSLQDHVMRTDYVNKRTPKVEEEFVRHVDKFKQVYNKDFHILIEWDTLDETTMAVCYSWTNGYREIHVDRVKWPTLTDAGQEQLLFHELGHCIFNLDHDEALIDKDDWDQIPQSIMYPYVFGNMPYYDGELQYYYNQLGGK